MKQPAENPRIIPFTARTIVGRRFENHPPTTGGRIQQIARPASPTAFEKSMAGPYPIVAGFQQFTKQWKHPGVSAILQSQALEIQSGAGSARFGLRPVLGPTEPMVPQRCQGSAISRLPRGPNPGIDIRRGLIVAKAIAAGLIIVTVLQVGTNSFNSSPPVRHLRALEAIQRTNTSTGPITRLRRAVEVRAATRIVEDFQAGMAAWGKGNAPPAGWSHHPEGYVQPGALALFRPSHADTDYELAFLGQIDHTSLGWVVRAVDRDNYYAGKLVVVEPGLRPRMAVEHYAVVHGKISQYSQTPIRIMIHNHMPFRVAVKVKGNQVATSIEGEQIDTWADDHFLKGGVGFFSDAGERSRVYWMELSRNQDWLGRVCARLSTANDGPPNAHAAFWLPIGLPGFQRMSASNVLLSVSTSIGFDATQGARTSNNGGGLFCTYIQR